ncbi:PAS domain S-box protein [Oculatella sp. FACHB-28]|uniref:PAS domain S-box protein n=1 Tax=Oculatella sp. FACHB-28 TaxID=2692845 RepID=UPI0016877748|nr:PAS domain S-box protein [Oculatella sp. FACHB-28]MBD2060210.1 PAS domain S-box protein [Oculatella sp. FACHB-28]
MLGAERMLLSRYSVAVLVSLLALLVRFLLIPVLGYEAPLLVFIIPVMISAWYGGLAPGMLATGLTALVGTYFFVSPYFSFNIDGLENGVRIIIFLIEGILISSLSEALRRARQRAERTAVALQESEDQYRLLVEGVKDYAIFMLDPNGRITSWNTGAERLKGYSAPEVLGRHFSLLFAPESVEQHQPEQQLHTATIETRYEGQGWRRRKDGSLFWADVVLTALHGDRGNLRGFVEVTRDVTARRQAESTLQKTLKDLSDVKFALDQAAILAITDAQGTITEINDKFCELSKFSKEELIGQNHRIINSGYHAKEFFHNLWRTITQGEVWHGEIKNRAKDGTYYWVDTTIVPLLDESGKPVQYLAVRFDITSRKQAEEALAQEKATSDLERKRLRAILDILPVGVFIANANGTIIDMNPATRTIWGEEAPMPGSVEEYREYKGWRSGTNYRLSSQDWALTRALQEGRTYLNEEVDIETFDGQRKTILNSAVPILDRTGETINAVTVNVDITRRKQAEESLRRTVQRLETLQQIDRAILQATSSEAIARSALLRLNQVIAYQQAAVVLFDFETNEAQVLAGQVDSTKAGSITSIASFSSLESLRYRETVRYIEDLSTMLQRPPMLEYQFRQGTRSVLIVALLIEGDLIGDLYLFANEPAAFDVENRAIAQEIANQLAVAIQQARLREQLQLHAAELEQRVESRTAELQEANEALQAFAYSVSHDLRAPLRSMAGLGTILLEDYGDRLDGDGQEYTQRIVQAARDMDTLILDLLEYSRLSRSDIQLRVLNLNAIIAEVLSHLRSEIDAKHAEVVVESPLPEVEGHYAIFSRILTNLLTNALKFTRPDHQPQIHLWTEERLDETGAWVRLWVEDDGIGIEPRFQEQIFQVFERLHSAEVYPGTGIGLAIVRKGAERMGGRVGVESQVGQGSRFWIELRKPLA